MLKDKQHFWHDFCRISHPNFQTRVPASLAQFSQSTSITNSSISGTIFAEYRIPIFKPASQHLWHSFSSTSHPNFQTRVPASLARFLQHIAPQFSNPRPSISGTIFAEYRIPIFKPASQHLWHALRQAQCNTFRKAHPSQRRDI